jgi:hypothetical protein
MPGESTVELSVKYSFGEFLSANLTDFLRRLRFVLAVEVALLVFAGSATTYGYFEGQPGDKWTTFGQDMGPIFLWLLFVLFISLLCPFTSTWKSLRDPRTKAGYRFNISHNSVRIEGSAGVSDLNWTAFVSAREVPDAFYLYLT